MLESSPDILRITIALCIAVFTGFVCWAIYSGTRVVRQVSRMMDHIESLIKTVETQVNRLQNLFNVIEEKIHGIGTALPIVVSGIKSIMEFMAKRRAKKAQKKSSQKNAF